MAMTHYWYANRAFFSVIKNTKKKLNCHYVGVQEDNNFYKLLRQSWQMEWEERDRERTAGRLEEEGRGERKEKQQREERIEGCVLLPLKPQSYITCEGLYGVLISCYGNKIFPILLVADQFVIGSTELIHYNHLLLWKKHWIHFNHPFQFQEIFGYCNHVHVTSCLCMCVSVHTNNHRHHTCLL